MLVPSRLGAAVLDPSLGVVPAAKARPISREIRPAVLPLSHSRLHPRPNLPLPPSPPPLPTIAPQFVCSLAGPDLRHLQGVPSSHPLPLP